MKIRRLNQLGIKKFEDYLKSLKNPEGSQGESPFDLLENPETSEPFPWEVEIEQKIFANRYEMGLYLVSLFERCEQSEINFDRGLWSWLALFFFDQLCSAGTDGRRRPSQIYNYILSSDRRHQQRHAIRTTYLFVKEYGETVYFMFSNPLDKRGEITEQLASRQDVLGCRGVIEAACSLYYDNLRKSPKRGASGKGPGTVRRFGVVLRQFARTYDLFSLSGQRVLEILPGEFDRFRSWQEESQEGRKARLSLLQKIFRRTSAKEQGLQ